MIDELLEETDINLKEFFTFTVFSIYEYIPKLFSEQFTRVAFLSF